MDNYIFHKKLHDFSISAAIFAIRFEYLWTKKLVKFRCVPGDLSEIFRNRIKYALLVSGNVHYDVI